MWLSSFNRNKLPICYSFSKRFPDYGVMLNLLFNNYLNSKDEIDAMILTNSIKLSEKFTLSKLNTNNVWGINQEPSHYYHIIILLRQILTTAVPCTAMELKCVSRLYYCNIVYEMKCLHIHLWTENIKCSYIWRFYKSNDFNFSENMIVTKCIRRYLTSCRTFKCYLQNIQR